MTTYPDEMTMTNGATDRRYDGAQGALGRSGPDAGTITVGIINDYEVVVRGVASMLAPYANRIQVVELDAGGLPRGRPTSPCSTRSPGGATR